MLKHHPEDFRWSFIAWAPYSPRSTAFAQLIGGPMHYVHYLKFQSPRHAPLKYILQSLKTLEILFRENPDVVHVQNPPFLAALMTLFFCKVRGAQFVWDHHSAAFLSVWQWALPLEKFLASRAAVNVVTNKHWAAQIEAWGGPAFVVPNTLLDLPPGETYTVRDGFNVVVVNTFAPDEPLGEVLAAARQVPDINFYITGNTKRRPDSFFEGLPDNVIFTGFVPEAQYIGLLEASSAVMSLTTRDFTMQQGACDGILADKPVIVSDWPFLQTFFSQATVYVPNNASGIAAGLRRLQKNYATLSAEVPVLRELLETRLQQELAELQQLVAHKAQL